METKLDSVGRVVVPKPLRDALGLSAGSTVDISRYGPGLQLVPAGRTARMVDESGVLVDTGETAIDDEGVAGGAVYDALVGLAAVEHGATLATRDGRAAATYEAVGARIVAAGD